MDTKTTLERRPRARETIVDHRPDGIEIVPDKNRFLSSIERVLTRLWSDWRLGVSVAVATAAGWGLIAGWWTPRGPLTTSQALLSIVFSACVGGVAGLVMRSRWSMLAGPVAFGLVFELARLGVDGPTVDGPNFSTYGILALVVGRGFHGLLSIFPMVTGAAWATGASRRYTPGADRIVDNKLTTGGYWRRGVALVATVALVGLSALIARPASTDAIVDAGGRPIPGSVAELSTVDIGGHDLHLMIRGHSVDNPVLLFLAGGPGGSEMGAMRNHLPELEEHFTVVTWDQRGTGKSYTELDPTSTYTLEAAVTDTIAMTNHLRERFGQDQIYLVGQSWGSTLGVLAVQQQPELYSAFIGVGQMVSPRATDTIFYTDTLAWARANGDTGLVDELTKIGPPPYQRMLDYETALSFEHEVYPYDHSANSEGEGGFSENFLVSEYSLVDQVHLLGAFMDTFAVLYPQLQDIDFRETATEFSIPMFFVQGAHEADGRAEPFAEWYPTVSAPLKERVELDTSGHRPMFEQPDEFIDFMLDTVLVETQGE